MGKLYVNFINAILQFIAHVCFYIHDILSICYNIILRFSSVLASSMVVSLSDAACLCWLISLLALVNSNSMLALEASPFSSWALNLAI